MDGISRSRTNFHSYAFTNYLLALITALSIWNLAEVQIGIVAACGPTLRQPLARLMPSIQVVASLLSNTGLSRSPRKPNPIIFQVL